MIYNFDKSQLKTIEDYEKAHRDFWNFIADNHLFIKPIISGIESSCFACEYAKCMKIKNKHYDLCKFCPVEKKYCKRNPACYGGWNNALYFRWFYAETQEEKDRIAREIAKAKFTEPKED